MHIFEFCFLNLIIFIQFRKTHISKSFVFNSCSNTSDNTSQEKANKNDEQFNEIGMKKSHLDYDTSTMTFSGFNDQINEESVLVDPSIFNQTPSSLKQHKHDLPLSLPGIESFLETNYTLFNHPVDESSHPNSAIHFKYDLHNTFSANTLPDNGETEIRHQLHEQYCQKNQSLNFPNDFCEHHNLNPSPLIICNKAYLNDNEQRSDEKNQFFDNSIFTSYFKKISSINDFHDRKNQYDSFACTQNNLAILSKADNLHFEKNGLSTNSNDDEDTNFDAIETQIANPVNASMIFNNDNVNDVDITDKKSQHCQKKSTEKEGFSNSLSYHIRKNRKSAFINQYSFIVNFLQDNQKFSEELNQSFLKRDSHLRINLMMSEMNEISKQKTIKTKREIESYDFISMPCKNSLPIANHYLSNFCSFCIKKNCKMFSNKFNYSHENLRIFVNSLKYSRGSAKKIGVYAFVDDIYQMILQRNTFNLETFLSFFMEQRNALFELIKKMQSNKIHVNKKHKINLTKEIFHNFKCYNSKVKINMIPEFIHLFFMILNRELNFYHRISNSLFLIFVFYMESFDQIINIILDNKLLHQKISKNSLISPKIVECIISLLLRINFIEPLVILFNRNEDGLRRYRFHVLSLFHLQYLASQNENYDREKMKFLLESIHWIFYCVLHFSSKAFLYIYETKDLKSIISHKNLYFCQLSKAFHKLTKNEPYLISQSFGAHTESEILKNFLCDASMRYEESCV